MPEERFTLPDAPEMMRRLQSVVADPHTIINFYPKIVRHASEVNTAAGLKVMFSLALYDYSEKYPGPVIAALNAAVPDFIQVLTAP